jgi:catechol 2,3-dioxygenase-like lactoylglutathione lyase family enzyme
MTSAGAGGGVFLLGGQPMDHRGRLDTLWSWNGTEWRVITDAGPSSRTLPGAAFDSRRDVLVVYGGLDLETGATLDDLWEWDGHRWNVRQVAGPGPRDHHAMAFDEARGTVVLYGGGHHRDRTFLPTDTWTWDGSTWRLVDSATGPGGLVHHAMAYDARRQRVVMFGGSGGNARPRNGDTWEWDGVRWSRLATDGPPPRNNARMAYDAKRGVTVLFGGGGWGDTWTWDGVRWHQHQVAGPPARGVHAMAYDARRERVIMYAGNTDPPFDRPEPLGDLWEWDGERWHGQPRPQADPQPALAASGAFFALTVPNLESSARWYRQKFGLRVLMQPPKSGNSAVVVLEGNGLIVELVQHDDARPLRTVAPSLPGNLYVHGIMKAGVIVDDIDQTLAMLRSRGVEIAMGPFPRTATQRANFIVRDNAGNLIQFIGK